MASESDLLRAYAHASSLTRWRLEDENERLRVALQAIIELPEAAENVYAIVHDIATAALGPEQ